MFEINEWNENKNFSTEKLAQDVINKNNHNMIKTSCCIDTTKMITGPCNSVIASSCCIDTVK